MPRTKLSNGKKILKSLRPERLILFNFKLTREEEVFIRRLAEEYAGGNVSGWVRYAALNYQPSHDELTEVGDE